MPAKRQFSTDELGILRSGYLDGISIIDLCPKVGASYPTVQQAIKSLDIYDWNRQTFVKDGNQRCCACKQMKPFSDFVKSKAKHSGYGSRCSTCRKEYSTAYNRSGRKRAAAYGLSLEQLNSLWERQQGSCAICHKVLTPGKRGYVLDHDHSTGNVRGLLCIKCNVGLGMFEDNSVFLRGAINYLRITINDNNN